MKMFKGQIAWKDGYWLKVGINAFWVCDENGNEVYFENTEGYWSKREHDENGNEVYFENTEGYWWKREYDENGNNVYYENSYGKVIDIRKKDVTPKLTEEQIKQVKEMLK